MVKTCAPGISLYRRAIGATYDSLPAVLRRFHDAPTQTIVRGSFRITRGRGRLRNWAASLMRLPAAGERVSVRLQIEIRPGGERWIRDFGAQRLVTEQWCRDGFLIEAAGPLRFGFRLSADATRMLFEMERCWFLFLPVPLVLAPHVHAVVSGRESSWWTLVQIDVPVLGMLAKYEGEMIPEC